MKKVIIKRERLDGNGKMIKYRVKYGKLIGKNKMQGKSK
jgi:hypothetical protein